MDRYDNSDTADRPTKHHMCASPNLKLSQAAYSALYKVGFVTAIGCVCCWPIQNDENTICLYVCTERLAIAAKALGESISKKQMHAFMRTGSVDKNNHTGITLDIETIVCHWLYNNIANIDTAEKRKKFVLRFDTLLKSTQLSTSHDIAWGIPCSRDCINDETLKTFMDRVGCKYQSGAHYGFGWSPIPNQRLSKKFNVTDIDQGCFPARISFVTNTFVPGQMWHLMKNDKSTQALEILLSRSRTAINMNPPPTNVLQETTPSDGRIILLPMSVCHDVRCERLSGEHSYK